MKISTMANNVGEAITDTTKQVNESHSAKWFAILLLIIPIIGQQLEARSAAKQLKLQMELIATHHDEALRVRDAQHAVNTLAVGQVAADLVTAATNQPPKGVKQ